MLIAHRRHVCILSTYSLIETTYTLDLDSKHPMGGLAHMVDRSLRKGEAAGSIPVTSTFCFFFQAEDRYYRDWVEDEQVLRGRFGRPNPRKKAPFYPSPRYTLFVPDVLETNVTLGTSLFLSSPIDLPKFALSFQLVHELSLEGSLSLSLSGKINIVPLSYVRLHVEYTV